jgi:signal transduction histidine kinase
VREVADALAAIDWSDRDNLAPQIERVTKRVASLSLEGDLSSETDELIGIVEEGLKRTQRLVGDLRDFALPGGGKHAQVDVAKGLRSTASLLHHDLSSLDVALELDLPADLPRIEADASALNQVFLNLIKNAAEAMEGKGGSVRVRVRREGVVLHIAVADDGPGIPPEVRTMLFEPFFTTKQAGRGTGLGLSIARQIAEAHGGSLDVESTLGEGTTFTLTLPLEAAPAEGDSAA